MVPTTRAEFKELILRRLGKPVINIEVSEEQVEDRVDFALRRALDYHYDFSDYTYYKYQLTDTDITNQYVDMPSNIMGVVEIFDLSGVLLGGGDWNATYQFVLNNVWEWSSGMSLIPYFMAFQHLQLIEQILVGKQPIRYNRFVNRLYVDTNWDRFVSGNYIIAKAYQVVDPNTYTRIWGDAWLIRYATAQVKQQWGNSLKKYVNTPLPGGLMFSGQQIYDEATQEIVELESELMNDLVAPAAMMLG